jgi:NAD(P)-dependent dehydrogenase (short-subunit alcohol dehydrogenase family)
MSTPQVALVTGASSGFGLVTACLLAENGFAVFGTSRRMMPDAAGVAMRQLDVTAPESITHCVQDILATAGRIDLLVNNAGQTHASFLEETPLAAARQVFETNFWGVVGVTNAVLPTMRARRCGRIINVSSLAGLIGAPGQGFYAASKHALEGYTETLQTEVASFNIAVSLVEPRFLRGQSQICRGQVGQSHAVARGRQGDSVTAGAAARIQNIGWRWRQILAQRPQRNGKLRAMSLQAIPPDGRVLVVVGSYIFTSYLFLMNLS